MRYRAVGKFITVLFAFMAMFITVKAYAAGIGIVNANNGLNLRSTASTDGEILAVIPNRTEVTIVQMTSGWSLVEYRGQTGYVYNQYILLKRGDMLYRSRSAPILLEPMVIDETVGETVDETVTGQAPTVVDELNANDGSFIFDGEFIFDEAVTLEELTSVMDELLAFASNFLGTPYVSGGTSPKGFDCSGFTYYVYKQYGYTLNRTAAGQSNNGRRVSRSELQPGDLVFFNTSGSGIGHVGIYVGNGSMIHSVKPGVNVRYDTIDSGYYNSTYYCASRIIE